MLAGASFPTEFHLLILLVLFTQFSSDRPTQALSVPVPYVYNWEDSVYPIPLL